MIYADNKKIITKNGFFSPLWLAPKNISAVFSEKFSEIPELLDCLSTNNNTSLNERQLIQTSEQKFCQHLGLPSPPVWINQVHQATVKRFPTKEKPILADGCVTSERNTLCAVSVADCLPILLTCRNGKEVAAVHAGWRGLLAGVVQNALLSFHAPPEEIIVWIGPHISQIHYPIGEALRQRFIALNSSNHACFKLIDEKWHLNLALCATMQLKTLGVSEIYTDERCTFDNTQKFFSHRRGDSEGRMAAIIWIS